MTMRLFLVLLAYTLTGWLGLQMPYLGQHITLVWLPTGISVAALLRWGRPVWPGVFVGALLVNLSVGSSLPLASGIAIGNTLAPLLAAHWLKQRGFHACFDRQRDVGLFIAAAALGMLLSASGGVACLLGAGVLPFDAAGSAWLSWWMGDAVGALLAGPLLLSLSRKNLLQLGRSRRALLLWLAIAVPVAWFAFAYDYVQIGRSLPLAFLTLPLFAWAALRFGISGTAFAGLAFSVVAAWSTANGHGTFALPNAHVSLILLWTYMASTVLTGLMITALQAERLQTGNTLRESEEKLRALYEMSPLGIALTDMNGNYVDFNAAFQDLCGYTAAELKTLDYWALTPKKYQAQEALQLESLRLTGRYGPYEKEYIRKDGSLIPLQLNGTLITGTDGQHYIWSIIEDITARKRAAADMKIAATALDAQICIVVTDAKNKILKVNRAFTEVTGYTAEEVVGRTPRLFHSRRHDENFYRKMWEIIHRTGTWQGEVWDRRKDGTEYPKWLTISTVKDDEGAVSHYIGAHHDISERKKAEERIEELAFFDPLTRLPNRTLLQDRLKQALTVSSRNGTRGALLFIDLDNFKTLNDTLGHDKGDLLLQQVAQRLSACVREGDTVARLGGDEFVVVLSGLRGNLQGAASRTEEIGKNILAELRRVYMFGRADHRSTASIGATLFNGHEASAEDLMRQADLAMYKAKAGGRNALCFFDVAMHTAVMQRVAAEDDLRRSIQEQQFVLHYQAQVTHQGRVTGAEVLVRWKHPERGVVAPLEFIPLAEDTGLILPLGHWVLETACMQLARWASDPVLCQLTVAVNVSARQFGEPGFVDQVLSVLQASGANPQRLKLELTESLLIANVEEVIAKMFALKAKGVGFSLDDFGTGYSSLTYLKQLPLDQLKIDQSFIRDILIDPNDAAIAKTVVALANSLGLGVIAEGVETQAQRDFLAEASCHAYQGHFFSRPLPVELFETFVAQDQARLELALLA